MEPLIKFLLLAIVLTLFVINVQLMRQEFH